MPQTPAVKTEKHNLTEIDKYRLRLEQDLKIAERVHRSMIPVSRRRGDLEIVCDFTPILGVGGDYASVHFQTDRQVVVGICDVSGHGVASALLASRVNSFVLNLAPSARHPCEVVEALNTFVYRTFRKTELYLTFFCLFLDLDKQTLVAAGCGHPPLLLCSRERDVIIRQESENTIIGLFEDLTRTCTMLQLPFRRGDRLILYTDGISDAMNADDAMLGVDGLEGYFREAAHLPPKQCVEAIVRRVNDFRNGVPAEDDQLLLAISYLDESASASG